MIMGIHGVDPARAERLMKVMDVNPNWRMHLVSDGQRRRVQICVGLLKPFKVSTMFPSYSEVPEYPLLYLR